MQIGLSLPTSGKFASKQAVEFIASEAERIGCASLWVLERLLRPTAPVDMDGRTGPMSESYACVFEPLETLSYVAARTEHIKLGTSVIDAPFHNPVVLARRFATLDQLSCGRVIAGLGQGWLREEFVTTGIPMDTRGDRLEEFVASLRAVWGPDPVSYAGSFYSIPPSEINPKPVQSKGPPIIIAATKPRAIKRAARIGDGLNPLATSLRELEDELRLFRGSVREANRNPNNLQVILRANNTLTEDPLPAPRQLLSGSKDQIIEDLVAVRQLGVDHVFFSFGHSGVPLDKQIHLMESIVNNF